MSGAGVCAWGAVRTDEDEDREPIAVGPLAGEGVAQVELGGVDLAKYGPDGHRPRVIMRLCADDGDGDHRRDDKKEQQDGPRVLNHVPADERGLADLGITCLLAYRLSYSAT